MSVPAPVSGMLFPAGPAAATAAVPVLSGRAVDGQDLTVSDIHLRAAGPCGTWSCVQAREGMFRLTIATASWEYADMRASTENSPVRLKLRPATLLQQVTVASGSRAEELQDESAQRVEAVTIASQAKAALRALAEKGTGEGKRVLVIPVLLSYGGVEHRIRERLKGLEYTMASQGILTDPRIANRVLASVHTAQ